MENSRFKFRIWDIKQQKYRQRTHHEADTCLDCLSGKVLYGEGIEIYGEEDDKDVVLEQCTGLKDKNGKLIYEGDILRSESYPFKREEEGTYNYAAEVCFDKDSAVFFYWIFRTSSRVAGRSEGNTGQLDEYEWEVIGNIHTNADLLGEDND